MLRSSYLIMCDNHTVFICVCIGCTFYRCHLIAFIAFCFYLFHIIRSDIILLLIYQVQKGQSNKDCSLSDTERNEKKKQQKCSLSRHNKKKLTCYMECMVKDLLNLRLYYQSACGMKSKRHNN